MKTFNQAPLQEGLSVCWAVGLVQFMKTHIKRMHRNYLLNIISHHFLNRDISWPHLMCPVLVSSLYNQRLMRKQFEN